MHETTQRRVCRTAFVVGCVLPSMCVVVLIGYLHRPWRESDWQRMLQQQLHVRATVGEIRSPYPGITQLLDVQFADLRSERPLGSLAELRIKGWKSSLVADRIEIAATEFPAVASTIATWISSEELPELTLQAKLFRIVGARGEVFELKNVRLQSLVGDDSRKRIELQAEPSAAGEGASTLQLVVEHHAGQAEPVVQVSLDTKREDLPVWLLAEFVPGMQRCVDARFAGAVDIENRSSQLNGMMSGRIEGIDLQRWVDAAGPHRLEGTADMQLKSLRWADRRMVVLQGRLQAGAGRVNRSLLEKLAEQLFCEAGAVLAQTESSDSDQLLSFDELACDFQIGSSGLTIYGACESREGNESGCLLTTGGQPLLLQPSYRDLPLGRLVQVLMLSGTSWIPDTVEAIEMAKGLPLPSESPLKKKVAQREDLQQGKTAPR